MEDYYDQDLPTNYKCPKCGGHIISHPDCSLSCETCNFASKTNWSNMEKFKLKDQEKAVIDFIMDTSFGGE